VINVEEINQPIHVTNSNEDTVSYSPFISNILTSSLKVIPIFFGATLITPTNIDMLVSNSSNYSAPVYSETLSEQESNTSTLNYIDILREINLRKIMDMKSFEMGWNGSGGMAFSDKAIQFFQKVIANLFKQPELAPTGRNSLYMEYRDEKIGLLAYEVLEDYVTKVIVPSWDYSKMLEKRIYNNVIDVINQDVKEFYGFT